MIRQEIEQAIRRALEDAGAGEAKFTVERPASMEHGDYATNAALVARVDAHELAEKLHIEGVEKIEVAGKFINFFLSREVIAKEVEAAATNNDWGKIDIYRGKQVLVEYTSPNLFKPLHIGNLVGNVLGESIARLIEHGAGKVARLNYPSDIGLTVAKGVWGLWKNNLNPEDIAQLGQAYVAGNKGYEEDAAAKKEIEEINKALYEDSNPEWSEFRRKGIETSRRHLDELCAQLGTKFDKEFFESESGSLGRDIVSEHVGGIFEKSEGAVVFHGSHTRVFLNSQGLPTYEAKEVGLFDLKMTAFPDFDISITVTGSEQKEFFAVVFDAIQKIFPDQTKGKVLKHVANGFLKLTTGKMSSRLGNVITGESLLTDLASAAREKMQERKVADAEKVAQEVAVGAIKYTVLRQSSGKDIVFDSEKSLSLEGDSGPYVQYAHTRAASLIAAAKEAGLAANNSDMPQKSQALERVLLHFPEVAQYAAKELEPHYVTTYITELASAFNGWYASERVIGGGNPSYSLLLAVAAEKTLQKGLNLLGIPVPEEM